MRASGARGRALRQRLGAALSVSGVAMMAAGAIVAPARARADQAQAPSPLALASDRFAQDFLAPVFASDGQLSNQALGSPAARAAFLAGTADFAISGTPFSAQELGAVHPPPGYAYAPVAAGAIAFPYFVVEEQGPQAGTQDTTIKLSAPVISDLFTNQGEWTSEETTADNGSALVAKETHPFVLTGPDATSYWVTSWFTAEASASWRMYTASRNLANQASEQFPRGAPNLQQRDGFDLLLQGVFPNSTGVKTEALAYAPLGALADLPPGLPPSPLRRPVLEIKNKAGSFVSPTPSSVSTALAAAEVSTDGPTKNLVTPNFNATDAGAYPLIMVDEAIVPTTGVSPVKAKAIAEVLRQLVDPAYQASAVTRGYVPLTQPMVEATLAVANQLEQIQDTTSTSTTTTTANDSSSTSSTPSTSTSGSQPGQTCPTSPGSGTVSTSTTSTSSPTSTMTSTSSTTTTTPTTTTPTTPTTTTPTTTTPTTTTPTTTTPTTPTTPTTTTLTSTTLTSTTCAQGTPTQQLGLTGQPASIGLSGSSTAGMATGGVRAVPSGTIAGASTQSSQGPLAYTGGKPFWAPVAAGMVMVILGEMSRRKAARPRAPRRS